MSLSTKLAAIWKSRASWKAGVRSLTPSLSSYGEDIIFDRLLRPGDRGTYVDVGANHPYLSSNTYRLYMKGWSGLTIDPNPAFASGFQTNRPRDKHLVMGVSETAGTLTYYEFEHNHLNSLSAERARELELQGLAPIRTTEVACAPLASIVTRELGDTHIDLLNIDAEGMDLEVLRSLDLQTNRPTVLMLENYEYYISLMHRGEQSEFERFVRRQDYLPIAQSAWSTIFVARDWQDLFLRSDAFDEAQVQNSYMPGQFERLPWVEKTMASTDDPLIA